MEKSPSQSSGKTSLIPAYNRNVKQPRINMLHTRDKQSNSLSAPTRGILGILSRLQMGSERKPKSILLKLQLDKLIFPPLCFFMRVAIVNYHACTDADRTVPGFFS